MRREARLKPEYAHLYPGMEPGAWEAAAILDDRVLACRQLLTSGGFLLNDRALNAEHFEFRGGSAPRGAAPDRLAADSRGAQHEAVGGAFSDNR
jgi:hypothetical protein